MKTIEIFAGALGNLSLNKLRSGLTLLGVVIGVAAVIAMSSIVEGGKRMIVTNMEKLGTNLLSVRPKDLTDEERRAFPGRSKGLRYSDLATVSEAVPYIAFMTPVITSRLSLKQGSQDDSVMVEGVFETYHDIQNYHIEQGRFLMPADIAEFKKVVVLGSEISEKMFRQDDPVGRDIKIGRQRFIVIGRLASKGALHGINYDQTVLIPATTMMKLFRGNDALTSLIVKIDERKNMSKARDLLQSALRVRHQGVEDFTVRSQDELVRNVEMVLFAFQVILGGTAALALLVGGIGIMNIMLVTVSERTSEIGLRMAIGASRKAILTQFLIESVALSVVGGLIGIAFGMMIGKGFGWVANRAIGEWQAMLVPGAIFLGFVFAVMVGIVFGLYPAYKASQLDPAESLRGG